MWSLSLGINSTTRVGNNIFHVLLAAYACQLVSSEAQIGHLTKNNIQEVLRKCQKKNLKPTLYKKALSSHDSLEFKHSCRSECHSPYSGATVTSRRAKMTAPAIQNRIVMAAAVD